jgi:hypothetical protein
LIVSVIGVEAFGREQGACNVILDRKLLRRLEDLQQPSSTASATRSKSAALHRARRQKTRAAPHVSCGAARCKETQHFTLGFFGKTPRKSFDKLESRWRLGRRQMNRAAPRDSFAERPLVSIPP